MKNLKEEIEGILEVFYTHSVTKDGTGEKVLQKLTSLIEQEKEKSEQIGFNKAWAVVKALMSYKTPEEALQYLAERKGE